MKKKTLLILGIVVVAITVAWVTYLGPSLRVASGYAAKYACSSTFIGQMSEDNLRRALDLSFVRNVNYTINHEDKTVEATLFGLAKQTARYYEQGHSCGCVLGETNFPTARAKQDRGEPSDRWWPQGDRMRDSVPEGVQQAVIQAVLKHTLEANEGVLAITVAYGEHLVGEAYQKGVTADSRLLGWSMTKSMGNALFGIMERKGLVHRDDLTGIPAWQDDARKEITINHLLQMSSGLKWTENYGGLSGVTNMLYLQQNFFEYAISPSATRAPDKKWYYSSGTTNILSGLMRQNLAGYQEYLDFPYQELFEPLGMTSAVIELDNVGEHVLSSYGWATARDWTRFGLLYLYEGNWFGEEIFTKEWVTYSTTPAAAADSVYGAQLWLNANGEKIPGTPKDAFYENGFGGQRILILPSRNLVVTVLSGNVKNFKFEEFYKQLYDLLPQQ